MNASRGPDLASAGLAHLARITDGLRLVWKAAPGMTGAWLALVIVQGALPALTVLLTRQLVDGLVTVLDSGGDWQIIRPVALVALAMAAVLIAEHALRSLASWMRTGQAALLEDHVAQLIHTQATRVDLAFYDSPDYHDRLQRVREEAGDRPLALLENLGGLLQSAITLFAISLILLPYAWWLPLVLVASTLPALRVALRHAGGQHRWWEQSTERRRRADYLSTLLTHYVYAAELRLFGLGPHFQSLYRNLKARLRSERLHLAGRESIAEFVSGLFALAVTTCVLAWIGYRAIQGSASLGDVALFFQAFNRGQSLMRMALDHVGEIYRVSLFLENLLSFLRLAPSVIDPVAPAEQSASTGGASVRFRGVHFRYPGSDRTCLAGFDLQVEPGQFVAIVGPNGAGKSTVLKLLCRFYDPDEGRVELDGQDLRSLSLERLRRRLSALFQEPVPYQDTAAVNITLGDVEREAVRAEIRSAAQAAGAADLIERLPGGYDAQLGTWFTDGTELSVGQWQRVALARACWRQADLVLLDEPTSHMDSWAEADWLKRFRALVGGRTAIIVTHRFTTAMHADRIHVLEDGRVTESGSHAELVAGDGPYARSWREQTRAHEGQSGPPKGD